MLADEELNALVERLANWLSMTDAGYNTGQPYKEMESAASAIRQLMSEREELRKAIEAAEEEMEDRIWNIMVEMGERR